MSTIQTVTILRELRDGGLSQSEISRLTGIPQPRISRWEAGSVPDSVDDALRLLELRDKRLAANGPQSSS